MSNRQIANNIAREIMAEGDEPNSPCQRIQFMGGSYFRGTEKGQGGLCESALADRIASLLDKYLSPSGEP